MAKIIWENCKHRYECELVPYDVECDKKFEKSEKNFEKPIDKSNKVWYNKYVIKRGYEIKNQKRGKRKWTRRTF